MPERTVTSRPRRRGRGLYSIASIDTMISMRGCKRSSTGDYDKVLGGSGGDKCESYHHIMSARSSDAL